MAWVGTNEQVQKARKFRITRKAKRLLKVQSIEPTQSIVSESAYNPIQPLVQRPGYFLLQTKKVLASLAKSCIWFTYFESRNTCCFVIQNYIYFIEVLHFFPICENYNRVNRISVAFNQDHRNFPDRNEYLAESPETKESLYHQSIRSIQPTASGSGCGFTILHFPLNLGNGPIS